jgi:hypothetical protein
MLQEAALLYNHSAELAPTPAPLQKAAMVQASVHVRQALEHIATQATMQDGPLQANDVSMDGPQSHYSGGQDSASTPQVETGGHADEDQPPPSSGEAVQPLPLASSTESDAELQLFIQQAFNPAPAPLLETLAKKAKVTKNAEVPTIRRSGRLAQKAQTNGRKTVEELVQDILCKKLEGCRSSPTIQARDRLTKLFEGPIPQEAMEAIEDLLKVINLETKTAAATAPKAARKALAA